MKSLAALFALTFAVCVGMLFALALTSAQIVYEVGCPEGMVPVEQVNSQGEDWVHCEVKQSTQSGS